MVIKQIRLSQVAKDQLSRLKGKTGIQHWNVLCRWAFCLSVREATRPADVEIGPESNVEMSWQTFGGEYHELYAALLIQRCLADGLELDEKTLQRQFRLHLHRGISYLAATGYVKSCSDLIELALTDRSPDLLQEG